MKKIEIKIENDQLCYLGHLTVDTAEEALALSKLYFKNQKSVTINLKGVTSCDSAALALMIALMRFAKKQNVSLKFVHLPKQVTDIARVSGIDSFLPYAS